MCSVPIKKKNNRMTNSTALPGTPGPASQYNREQVTDKSNDHWGIGDEHEVDKSVDVYSWPGTLVHGTTVLAHSCCNTLKNDQPTYR